MKIAVVTPYDLSRPSGVNHYALTLARWQRTQGHEVQVIGPASRPHAAPDDAIVLGRPRAVPVGGTVGAVTWGPRLSGRVQMLLAREGFEIVHVHEPAVPALPALFLRHATTPCIATFHAAEPSVKLLYRLSRHWLRPRLQGLAARTAVSPVARDMVATLLGRDGAVEIVPGCVNVGEFAASVDAPPALDTSRRTILFVGRGESRKGLDTLLAAYEQVRHARPDTQLLIVGPDGSAGRHLAARLERRGWTDAIFTGPAPLGDLPRYYQTADVFCAPATGGEAFGLVLLEAMAAGTPVIASDVPGYRAVLSDGADGLLVPPRDVAALAAAILRLLDDAGLQTRLRTRGLARAQTFDVAVIGRQMLNLYDRNLSRA